MASKGIHALPVVDDRGYLIGIISTSDIISAALQCAAAADAPAGADAAASNRLRDLEAVFVLAKRYVNAGQDEQLHGQLLRAIEHAKRGAVDI